MIAGCSAIPTSGPSRGQINDATEAKNNVAGIQLVDVTDTIARQLYAERTHSQFSTALGGNEAFNQRLGIGDTVEVSIWEAPPATLFGAGQSDTKSGGATVGAGSRTVLPEQMVDANGKINIPFVGGINAAGITVSQLQSQIAGKLKSLAHDPQVLVRLSRNATSYVTVVGDVASSTRMQLTPRGERLLDALASAGGVKQSIDKITLQVTRGDKVASMPLESVIRDPRQNIALRADDVVTALFQPYSFTALGATGKNQEVNFEAQGITLAQAIARSGGLDDTRSDPQGIFIFRLEDENALKWPVEPVKVTADGKVPVIYRINLKDPNSFFIAQSFMMDNKDVLYVSNAPISDVQKVLNLVFSVVYPVVSGVQTFK